MLYRNTLGVLAGGSMPRKGEIVIVLLFVSTVTRNPNKVNSKLAEASLATGFVRFAVVSGKLPKDAIRWKITEKT